MITLLVFSIALVIAILLSELANRSILSAAVLFLVAGFIAGSGGFGLIGSDPHQPLVTVIAQIALCTVLFTDGMRAGVRDIAAAWRLPGRALLLGLPLTLLITALLAHAFTGTGWLMALLIGAILSPTDPVFAAAIVGRQEVPKRLRFLLNVESGVNDGLVLPVVLALLAIVGHEQASFAELGGELAWGIAIGIMVPLGICKLESSSFFGVAKPFEPLFAFAIGLFVVMLAAATNGNIYLAAFAAGSTIASTREDLRNEFHQFGELVTELAKLNAILVFGAMISPAYFADIGIGGYLFALCVLLVARPVALFVSLWGCALGWRERISAAWFGPKGFASIIYGLLLFQHGVPQAEHYFHIIAIAILASMIAHSTTDVLLARWFASSSQSRTAG
ncbi:MAG TPA: cation:proton antiporter [Chthoniobacterales bacterium]|nr:cation:proton antiporter [Chthoniobacterales bacterium]